METVFEFAVRWKVTERRVRRWIGRGMPHVDINREYRLLPEADLWVQNGGAVLLRTRSRRARRAAQ